MLFKSPLNVLWDVSYLFIHRNKFKPHKKTHPYIYPHLTFLITLINYSASLCWQTKVTDYRVWWYVVKTRSYLYPSKTNTYMSCILKRDLKDCNFDTYKWLIEINNQFQYRGFFKQVYQNFKAAHTWQTKQVILEKLAIPQAKKSHKISRYNNENIFCLLSLKISTYLCCPFEFTQWILPFQRRPGVKPWILPAFEWGSGVKSWSGILPFKRSCGFKPPIGPITVILTVINCGKKILVMGFRT